MHDEKMYLNVELERSIEIIEPLQKRLDNSETLEPEEVETLNYYQGYADAIRAVINFKAHNLTRIQELRNMQAKGNLDEQEEDELESLEVELEG